MQKTEDINTDFPLKLFLNKWAMRSQEEHDDRQAAPETCSGFAWEGLDDGLIPWSALKSAWRHTDSGVCPDRSVWENWHDDFVDAIEKSGLPVRSTDFG